MEDKNELVGSFKSENEAVRKLLEYGPETVIIQILLNIPPEKLEAFCSINKRIRSICKNKLVKGQYYEKNIFETDKVKDAKAYLERNPKGFLSIKKDNDFENDNLIELANTILFLDTDYDLEDTHFPNLKTWKFYYPNSNLLEKKSNYKDGKLDGLYREWYENGVLYQEFNYKDGEEDGLYRQWYENGQLQLECNLKDGKLDGLYRSWYENGQLKRESNYKDGKADGLYREWHKNGNLEEEFNYKDGKLNGLYRSWHDKGQLEAEYNYKDGKKDGLYRSWYENGKLWKSLQ